VKVMNELQTELADAIRSYVATSPLNRLRDIDGSPIWEEPLVGFADGNDPLFEQYKSVVTPEHRTPRQALAELASSPQDPSAFSHVGVVSWILPTAALTKESNRERTDGPSLRWNQTRFQGEDFNDSLRRYVVDWLKARGLVAVAPVIHASFHRTRGPFGICSTWSERHMAFAAGLGTFSLSDGLITARGIAHRCGSVVANVDWPASPRPYTDHRQYCPYARDGSCGACIERCPAGAIGPEGHDKDLCHHYQRVVLADWLQRPGYAGEFMSCGLCQTGVPCESGIP
jgi:epoxyqueuosine reductase